MGVLAISMSIRIATKILLLSGLAPQIMPLFQLLSQCLFGHTMIQCTVEFYRILPEFLIERVKSNSVRSLVKALKNGYLLYILTVFSYAAMVVYLFAFLHPWGDEIYFYDYWRYCLLCDVLIRFSLAVILRMTLHSFDHIAKELVSGRRVIRDKNIESTQSDSNARHERALRQLATLSKTIHSFVLLVFGTVAFALYKVIFYGSYLVNPYYRLPYFIYTLGIMPSLGVVAGTVNFVNLWRSRDELSDQVPATFNKRNSAQ
jgi:hypothetical protein